MTYLRMTLGCSSIFSVLVLLSACPGTVGEGGDGDGDGGTDTDETGAPQICIDPGTELLPEAKPATVPPPRSSNFTCTSGWGTDAPQLDPAWTVSLGEISEQFQFMPVLIDAHPEGGVVVAGSGVFRRYDADGDERWAADQAGAVNGQVGLAVEDAGTIVVSTYDWNSDDVSLMRFDAEGGSLGAIDVAWNGLYPNIWALETYGSDLVVGAWDEDSMGSWEQTLIRLDMDGNELLRKSTNMVGGQLLAANASGTLLFGSVPGFLVSLDNGAVLGTLAPSSGFLSAVEGSGDDFYMVGGSVGDLSVGRYSSVGSERWLQTYDRATLNDQGRALDVGADGTLVVAGTTTLLDFSDSYWYSSQPIVMAVSGDGDALWSDRISAHGDATGVAIGSGGEVYVAGVAEENMPSEQEPGQIAWLRSYTP